MLKKAAQKTYKKGESAGGNSCPIFHREKGNREAVSLVAHHPLWILSANGENTEAGSLDLTEEKILRRDLKSHNNHFGYEVPT
jgi:hypothetical protein